ncbi:MAG: elongation factor P [Verrucomicrobiota bacterium]|jgi:elongation factor P|nr:elongation factor P [Verrucomicrobiota bacterium]MDI9383561.1 elongation factor P [Verrucomicrobiota bacterium]
MASANNLRKGMVIYFRDVPHEVLDANHRTPGKGQAVVQTLLRNLRTQKTTQQRFNSTESVDVAVTERTKVEYSYSDGSGFHFMDPETYETITLNDEMVGDAKQFLTENLAVMLLKVDGTIMGIDLPSTVDLKVTVSAEGLKGDSASNVQKPATVETGLTLNVPLFIKEGDVITINTTTGEYMGRSNS